MIVILETWFKFKGQDFFISKLNSCKMRSIYWRHNRRSIGIKLVQKCKSGRSCIKLGWLRTQSGRSWTSEVTVIKPPSGRSLKVDASKVSNYIVSQSGRFWNPKIEGLRKRTVERFQIGRSLKLNGNESIASMRISTEYCIYWRIFKNWLFEYLRAEP